MTVTPSRPPTSRQRAREQQRNEPARLSGRGLLVGVALMVLNGYFAFYAEPMRNVAFTSAAPFANVIFLLFLLTALNALLRRLLPRVALGSADLVAVYVMLSIQSGLGDTRAIHSLISTIAG